MTTPTRAQPRRIEARGSHRPRQPRPFRTLSMAMLKAYFRDRINLFFAFLFPLMFLTIFGLLFAEGNAGKIKIAAVGDGAVISALQQSPGVEVTRVGSVDEALGKVREGDLPAAVVQQGDSIQLRYAASDQAKAGQIQGLITGVVNQMNLAATGQPPKFALDSQQAEDASLKPIQFLTPGLLAFNVSLSAALGAAVPLVGWRRKQVLRRIRLAPVNVSTVLTSRLLVIMGMSLVQAALFIGVAVTPLFGLQLSGQWWLAVPLMIAGTLAFFSIGMLIGAFCKTEEATAGAANVFILPMAFLSGTFFNVDQMPDWLMAVSKALPLRHIRDGMLDVLVRGKGIEALTVPMAVLFGFTLVVGLLAVKLFNWEDD